MAECPTCGDTDFQSERGMKYHHATVHGESISHETYTCTWCDDQFERHPSSITDSDNQFCSSECMGSWIEHEQDPEDTPRWDGGEETLTCSYCGDVFERYPSNQTDSEHEFCSPECWGKWSAENIASEDHPRWNGGKLKRDCEWCGETVRRKPAVVDKNEHTFCSVDCQGKWRSEHRTGEDAFSWRGGHKDNYGPTWSSQRLKAVERDDHECQDCGMGRDEHYDVWGHDLEVHHKTPIRTFSDTTEANKLSNLITLCKSCHIEREHSDE